MDKQWEILDNGHRLELLGRAQSVRAASNWQEKVEDFLECFFRINLSLGTIFCLIDSRSNLLVCRRWLARLLAGGGRSSSPEARHWERQCHQCASASSTNQTRLSQWIRAASREAILFAGVDLYAPVHQQRRRHHYALLTIAFAFAPKPISASSCQTRE